MNRQNDKQDGLPVVPWHLAAAMELKPDERTALVLTLFATVETVEDTLLSGAACSEEELREEFLRAAAGSKSLLLTIFHGAGLEYPTFGKGVEE